MPEVRPRTKAARDEQLVFPIKIPRHLPPYIEADIVARMLDLARETPKDYLILRLMSDAGLRRQEVVDLKVKNVSERGCVSVERETETGQSH